MMDVSLQTKSFDHKGKNAPAITHHRLALARQLPHDERLKAAAAAVAERRPIKPTKQIVADLYGVSITGIDKVLNGSRRRQPRIAPQTLEALQDLWAEALFLAGEIKYQSGWCARERTIAFERFLAKWLTGHSDALERLAASGGSAAIHAEALKALFALVAAIVANYAVE